MVVRVCLFQHSLLWREALLFRRDAQLWIGHGLPRQGSSLHISLGQDSQKPAGKKPATIGPGDSIMKL